MKTLDLKKQFKHLYQPSAKKIEAAELDQFRAAGFEVEEPGLFDQGGSQ